ncbi:MAG: PPC domain-containing protein [Caldilineaceae bacterium]|nr:PPC domain-containing protein [Caldilineaceae bacterium]
MYRSHAVIVPTRLAVIVLTALLAFTPLAAMAAPVAQFGSLGNRESTGTPLLLGEYANATLANGESISYEIVIPESGTYLITAVDDAAAEDFDLVVTDETGNELFNDIFVTSDLTLETGTVTLTFTAVADNVLTFVVVGQIGGMSSDENQPGKLVPGSVYIDDNVSGTLYATLSIPPSTFPRQVLIALQADEEDIFYAYADGENVYASTTTDTNNILHFWTHGGDFNIQVEPYERRSMLTLIVFLTGEPPALTLDEPVEGAIPADATEVVYQLELDANYENLELAVDSDEALGVTLLDNYYDYDVYYSSYGEAELAIDALYPGVYYVLVQTTEAAADDIPFSLSIAGEAGRPTTQLEDATPFDDEFADAEASINYSFEVANPGALVTVRLTGDDGDNDFDLSVGLRPGSGNWSSYSYGPDESVTFLAPIAGSYYITVLSNGNTGPFTIEATEGDPATTLETNAVFYDIVEGRSRNVYLLPIEEAGQLLTVFLVGPEGTDLDLTVNGYNSSGDSILNLSGYSSGSAEVVGYLLPEAGLYEVAVSASYSDEGGYFFIQAQVVDPLYFGSQWAIDAVASSEYGTEGYSAMQATGRSDTPTAGDYATAWAPAQSDGGIETLELTYEVPVKPSALAIVESYNPGAITLIEAYNATDDEWVAIYEGEAAATEELYRVFIPDLTPVDFATNQIRLTLDTETVPGYNEIDAVQLFGRP